MIMKVYAVRDAAVSAFLQPFFGRSDAEAARSFGDACGDAKHQFATHLSDYSLFALGEFDDASGSILGYTSPVKIVDGIVYEVRSVPS